MNKLSQLILSCTLLLLVASCGGGGGDAAGTTSNRSSTGSVALLLTDGPTDEIDEVNLRIIKVELMSDGGRVTIFEGDETVNLLDYRHDAKIFAMDDGVPVGTYSKIRLTLQSIELVWRDLAGEIIETAYPKLPGSGKLDLNPRGSFDVNTDETLLLQIDIDAKKAIHIVKKGSKDEYNFRPVVFVDVLTTDFSGKLVRVFGLIKEIDDEDYENQHITLCDLDLFTIQPILEEIAGPCVEIYTDSDTGFFDDDGAPIDLNKVVVDQPITVVGNLMIGYSSSTGIEILAKVVERGEAGTYKTLQGKALSSVDADDQFPLATGSSTESSEIPDVTVQLQTGTIIIDPIGEQLSRDVIDEGVRVSVDAVPVASIDDNLVLAALVIVDLNDVGIDPVRGVIGSIPDGICGFSVLPADGGSDLSVRTSEDTLILKITSATSSELIKAGDLSDSVTVDLYGDIATDGCFDANAIIVFE